MSKPVSYTIEFDLPFILMVSDGFRDDTLIEWATAYKNGLELPYSRYAPKVGNYRQRVIGSGFPVYIPNETLAPPYKVKVNGIEASVRFLKRINPNRPTITVGEVLEDRYGKCSFSSVRVNFNLLEIPLNDLHEDWRNDIEVFYSLSVEAINHFIEHYRVFAKRAYVKSVTLEAIQEFFSITEYDDGTKFTQERGFGGGKLTSIDQNLPDSDSDDENLRKLVSSAEPPDIELILLANIYDYFALHEWRLALIETAIFFESWLSRRLRKKFTESGLLQAEIDSKFTDSNNMPRTITWIAKNLVKEIVGFDFKVTSEYSSWEMRVRNLRNEVVHGKKLQVTRQESIDAFYTVESAKETLILNGLT